MSDQALLKQIRVVMNSTSPVENVVPSKVATSHLTDDMQADNNRTIQNIEQMYSKLSDLRYRSSKAHKYHRGDQYHELMQNDDGEWMKEEDFIKERGGIPLKNNLIGKTIKNLVGQYRQSAGKTVVTARKRSEQSSGEMLTNALQSAWDLNQKKELDASTLKEGLIGGMFIQKVVYKYWPERDKEDLFVGKPVPSRMFFNSDLTDPRLFDLRHIGELHDLTLADVMMAFASNNEDAEKIKSWYSHVNSQDQLYMDGGLKANNLLSVTMPIDPAKCRVIESWKKELVSRMREHDRLQGSLKITLRTAEEIEAENQERIQLAADHGIEGDVPLIDFEERYEQIWTVQYLTPYGKVLFEGETPYAHQSHPYIMSFAQFVDGEAWGLVEDIIDQQRYINRLIRLIDFMMGTAAKGVLLIPEDAISDDFDYEAIASEWSKFDGVIKMKLKPNAAIPQQISQNVTNIGANEQLAIQFELMDKISGVSGAMQGQDAKSGTPSSLYAQQALNSSTNSRDVFEVFTNFKKNVDMKALKVMIQFYKEKRYLSIAGADYSEEARQYNPELVKDIEYDLVTSDGVDTPAYRMMVDAELHKLLELGAIDVKMYLQQSSYPFADKLLASMESKAQEQGQAPTANTDQQEAIANADTAQVAKVQDMLKMNAAA
ncbi:MAG: hypothetical protein GQ527_01665 [Bacteroidales bacterium]|nr:hypothetical protein [Bacteroidales bacterium]